MAIAFERCQKSKQAMVSGHFLYVNFTMNCPITSYCGALYCEQAGEEQITQIQTGSMWEW